MILSEFLESGLLEQYALGLMENQNDISLVEEMLSKHPEARKYYNDIQEQLLRLADEQGIDPPPSLKKKIIQNLKKQNTSPKSPFPWKIIGLTSLLASLVLGLLLYYNTKQFNSLQDNYALLEKDCSHRQIKNLDLLNFYAHYNTRTAEISSNDHQYVAFYNKELQKLNFKIINQPPLPQGKCLYLWGDKNNEMIKIGKVDDLVSNDLFASFDVEMVSLNLTLEDDNVEIKHPTVKNLVGSVSI